MSIERIPDGIEYISGLSDRPNDQDGMSALELKRRFDQGVADIKEYINLVLLPTLEASGAAYLGIGQITGLDAANVQEALEALMTAISGATAGAIPDGSLETGKLADLAVTTAKIAALAVTSAKIADLAVTAAKIADGAVTTDKLGARAVTSAKLALGAVASENIGSKAVKTANIDDGAVGTNQLANSYVTHEKTAGIQKQHATIAYVTLAAASWASKKQTVQANGVTASNTVLTAPWVANTSSGSSNWTACRDNGVRCVAQGDGTLTFECETVPSGALYFAVVIFD